MNPTPSLQVYIAGSGKLATELLTELRSQDGLSIQPWPGDSSADAARGIVVHAGSGREIEAIAAYCARSGSTLVELSTGSALEQGEPGFPVLLCPNTNILMLKFMHMLERSGPLFAKAQVQLIESHQASKHSVPGTAVQMAQALGLSEQAIESVRDPARQTTEFHIPPEHLARHAFHRITLTEGPCSISFETRVFGAAPYASGVQTLLAALARHPLQPGLHAVTELIEKGWL